MLSFSHHQKVGASQSKIALVKQRTPLGSLNELNVYIYICTSISTASLSKNLAATLSLLGRGGAGSKQKENRLHVWPMASNLVQ